MCIGILENCWILNKNVLEIFEMKKFKNIFLLLALGCFTGTNALGQEAEESIETIVAEADSLHLAYKRYTRQLAANLREGVLHDFLENLYPLTYQKQMPDGRIVTVNADTHEEMQ